MRLLVPAVLFFSAVCCTYAQQGGSPEGALPAAQPLRIALSNLPDSPGLLQQTPPSNPAPHSDAAVDQAAQAKGEKPPLQQPKRILGLMPNYRAVSAGTIPPPPTAKEAFMVATQNSFDYSAFVFTGLTSLIAKGDDSHPQLGKGVGGLWAYTWRGFVDKADGNYWVIFVLPSAFHEDERYYALGTGSILKRATYSVSRVAITPDYHGHNTVNAAELIGRGIAQGISLSYYPSQDRTAGDLATKYAYAVMRDAATNAFREFWPDIAVHVLHRQP